MYRNLVTFALLRYTQSPGPSKRGRNLEYTCKGIPIKVYLKKESLQLLQSVKAKLIFFLITKDKGEYSWTIFPNLTIFRENTLKNPLKKD